MEGHSHRLLSLFYIESHNLRWELAACAVILPEVLVILVQCPEWGRALRATHLLTALAPEWDGVGVMAPTAEGSSSPSVAGDVTVDVGRFLSQRRDKERSVGQSEGVAIKVCLCNALKFYVNGLHLQTLIREVRVRWRPLRVLSIEG